MFSAQEVFKKLPVDTVRRLKQLRGTSPNQNAMPSPYSDRHEGLKRLIEDLPKGRLLDVLKEHFDDNSLRVIVYRALKSPPAPLLAEVCGNQNGTSQPRDVRRLITALLGLHYEPDQITEVGFEKIRTLLEQLGFKIADVRDRAKNSLGGDANPGKNGTVILRRLFEGPSE